MIVMPFAENFPLSKSIHRLVVRAYRIGGEEASPTLDEVDLDEEYPLVMTNMAIENCLFIVVLAIKPGDFS